MVGKMINTRIINLENYKAFEIDVNGKLAFVVTTNANAYQYYKIENEKYIQVGVFHFWEFVISLTNSEQAYRLINRFYEFIGMAKNA